MTSKAAEASTGAVAAVTFTTSTKKLTGVGVDLDVDGHEDVGGAARVGDSPSGDGGGGSGREFVVSGGKSHSLDFAENGK